MPNTVERVIDIAKGEVGYHEGRSNGYWNNVEKYAPKVHGLEWAQGQAWCATFVSWVAMTAGVSNLYPRTASCDLAAAWFKQRNRWSEYPAIGAQVFYGTPSDLNHTGIVVDFDDRYITTVEGNTNNNGSREGDGVYLKKRERRLAYVVGYGYPDFPEGIVSADPAWTQEKPAPVKPPQPAPTPAPTPTPARRKAASLTVVDWNVQRDRGTKTVLEELQHLATLGDVLLLQEVAGYAKLLNDLEDFHIASAADDVAVLVRTGHQVKNPNAVRVTSRGWFTVRGGRTGPKRVASAIIDGIGFASVHTPPTVQNPAQRLAAPRRWQAYRQLVDSLHLVTAELGARQVVAGDWNLDANTSMGRWLVKRLAADPLNLRRHVPKDPTHGKRTIDYVFGHHAGIGVVRTIPGRWGSDHTPITFSVNA